VVARREEARHAEAHHVVARHEEVRHEEARHEEVRHEEARHEEVRHEEARREEVRHEEARRAAREEGRNLALTYRSPQDAVVPLAGPWDRKWALLEGQTVVRPDASSSSDRNHP